MTVSWLKMFKTFAEQDFAINNFHSMTFWSHNRKEKRNINAKRWNMSVFFCFVFFNDPLLILVNILNASCKVEKVVCAQLRALQKFQLVLVYPPALWSILASSQKHADPEVWMCECASDCVLSVTVSARCWAGDLSRVQPTSRLQTNEMWRGEINL